MAVGVYSGSVAITPDDNNDIPGQRVQGLYVAVAGTVVAVLQDGNERTFPGALAGTVLPFVVKRVKQSTTATVIGLTGLS